MQVKICEDWTLSWREGIKYLRMSIVGIIGVAQLRRHKIPIRACPETKVSTMQRRFADESSINGPRRFATVGRLCRSVRSNNIKGDRSSDLLKQFIDYHHSLRILDERHPFCPIHQLNTYRIQSTASKKEGQLTDRHNRPYDVRRLAVASGSWYHGTTAKEARWLLLQLSPQTFLVIDFNKNVRL